MNWKHIFTSFGVMAILYAFNASPSPRPAYAYDLPTKAASYTHYECKRATVTLYGVPGDTNTWTHGLNCWDWTRKVQVIQIVRKSSHTLYLNFDVAYDTYTYSVPTPTTSYVLDGALATNLIDNTFTFEVQSDAFSVYVASLSITGTAISATPDIRVIGYGR